MSLPREILDQLLSGYLDDALSADERDRVERLLEVDPDVAQELEELRQMRAALKSVSKADSGFKLPAGFADRVLDSAVASAKSEGLGDDHPLVRLAEQPSTKRAATGNSWRAASVLVALAASIVIAVIALRSPEDDQRGNGAEVAMQDPNGTTVEPIDQLDPATTPDPIDRIPEVDNPTERVVVAPPSVDDPGTGAVAEPTISVPDLPETDLVPEKPITYTPVTGAIASSDPVTPNPSMVSSAGSQNQVKQLGAILVLDIKRTEQGRASQAVKTAMRAVKIGAASEKKISEEIVGIARDADRSDENAKILYLQVSAKRLDQFIMKMFADREGIDSVRFMLAEDAPILGVVQSVRPIDPTQVQHAGTWQLASDDEHLVGTIAYDLQQRPNYLSMDESTARSGAVTMFAGAESNGPDFMTQVLVLIR